MCTHHHTLPHLTMIAHTYTNHADETESHLTQFCCCSEPSRRRCVKMPKRRISFGGRMHNTYYRDDGNDGVTFFFFSWSHMRARVRAHSQPPNHHTIKHTLLHVGEWKSLKNRREKCDDFSPATATLDCNYTESCALSEWVSKRLQNKNECVWLWSAHFWWLNSTIGLVFFLLSFSYLLLISFRFSQIDILQFFRLFSTNWLMLAFSIWSMSTGIDWNLNRK